VAAHLRRLRRECGSWEWVSIDIRERTGNEFGKAYLCRVGNETQAASQRLKDALFPPKPKVSKPRLPRLDRRRLARELIGVLHS